MIINQKNVWRYCCIFWWRMFFIESFYFSSHEATINFLFWTSLFFYFRLFYLSTRFLYFGPLIFCHLLPNLIPSLWPFLLLFWMLWSLVSVHKLCHVPYALRTWANNFYGNNFCCFQGMSQILVTHFLDNYS